MCKCFESSPFVCLECACAYAPTHSSLMTGVTSVKILAIEVSVLETPPGENPHKTAMWVAHNFATGNPLGNRASK